MANGPPTTIGVCSDSDRMGGRAGLSGLVESVATDVVKETNGSRGMGIGPGRPLGIVRDRARRYFDEQIETLARIAAGEIMESVVMKDGSVVEVPPKLDTRIRAIATLGKFGLGTNIGPESANQRVLEVRVVDESKEKQGLE